MERRLANHASAYYTKESCFRIPVQYTKYRKVEIERRGSRRKGRKIALAFEVLCLKTKALIHD